MNTLIQNILVFAALGFALIYLIKKFVWSPKKVSSKTCGDDNSCGCH